VPLSEYLSQKVRCPSCTKADATGAGNSPDLLMLERGCWLACRTCARKYPVVDSIPNLTIQEGDKWIGTLVVDLPVPPPSA
jgi:uncharacterized protein YbaR (Trm112 family)